MNKVTDVQAQRVVNQMGEKYSKSLCKTTKVMMNQSFHTAIQSDLCEHNPVQYLQISSYASEKKVLPFFAQEEIMIRKAASHILHGWWAVFLLETGMRVGEFAALQWKDVDLKNRILYVRKSKTESGVRLVSLSYGYCCEAYNNGLQSKGCRLLLSFRSIGLRGMRVALKLSAAGPPAAVFLFTQIYANPITENVDLLPFVLYDDVEFNTTLFSIWRCNYVYGRTP